ncbi:HTH domain-containing protein [Streptococcus danieliae]|uniref:HTH domain-containing protein n=1 Tax=Streptococcus danieliae TaxID=747656 RepID=A0A7Z0M4X8_9STRE|nr:HTH domain-containing protein [Streptococcus danieliae]MBF0698732.1 HTH domain-containing protein [Streptococcus danieliae]NYS95909.1 HTH domain-containing protein [Streptococcus danieliae]
MRKELSEKLQFLDRKPRLKTLFLLLFRSEGYVTSESIAAKLSVSSRTIKSDLAELKIALADIGDIVAKRAHGFKLVIHNSQLEQHIKEIFQIFPTSKIENSRDAHVLYILRRLLTSLQELRIEDFQRELLTTHSLTEELREVKKMLERYQLKLVTRPKHGMAIVGPRFKKLMLTVRVYRYFDMYFQTYSGISRYDELFECSVEDREKIRKIVLVSITKSRIVFSDLNLERFILYLIYLRNNLSKEPFDLPDIPFEVELTDEYRLVVEILNKLSNVLSGFDFSQEEIILLSYIAVISTDLYRFADCSTENYNALIPLAREGRNFLMKELSRYLRVDFFEDYTCFKDSFKIMIPISLKMFLGVSDSIDIRYRDFSSSNSNPVLRFYIQALSKKFYSQFGYEFSNRELDLLFTTFLGVLNRIVLDVRRLNLAIIAIDGRLSTQQLKFNLKHYFDDFIDKIETKTLYELNFLKEKQYDYYICSGIGEQLSIPWEPKYFVSDDVAEFDYDDSFKKIFFDAYSYDRVLPPISISQTEMFGHSDGDVIDVEKGEVKIRFLIHLDSEKEKICVYRDHMSQYIISVAVDVRDNFQKLKMLLNVLNSMVEASDILLKENVTYRDLLS